MPVQMEVVGLANLSTAQKRVTSMQKAFALSPRRTVYEAAMVLKGALKESAPRKTGQLRDSIGFRTAPTPVGAGATFRAAPHAIFVIGGTRPHPIYPKPGMHALFWPGAAHPVRMVNHPGTKPNDFRKKAWAKARPAVREILKREGVAIFRGDELGAPISI